MISVASFFGSLFILFLLSRMLQREVSALLFRLFHSEKVVVYSMAFLFLPGTIIHELAHYIMANLLFVRTGEIELMPKMQGDSIKLGSVSIVKPDPFRYFLIGIAPFLSGIALILLTLYYGVSHDIFSNTWLMIVLGYLVFQIGNSMFSSKKDMEGAFEFFVLVFIIAIVAYVVGFRPSLQDMEAFISPQTATFFSQGTMFVLVPVGIDIVLLLFAKIFNRH